MGFHLSDIWLSVAVWTAIIAVDLIAWATLIHTAIAVAHHLF